MMNDMDSYILGIIIQQPIIEFPSNRFTIVYSSSYLFIFCFYLKKLFFKLVSRMNIVIVLTNQ